MPHRISLATQITGNFKHLKRSIKDLLNSRGVGHILQTTQMNDSEKLTSLFMEGESIFLYTVREELVSHLRSIFPGICIQDWKEMASDAPLFGSQFGSISRDQTQRLESKWNDCFYSGFIQVVPALQHGRPVAIDIQSSIDRITEKLIHITYKNNTVYKSIGAFLPWTRWKQVIQECKELEIKQPISGIYSLLDTGEKSYELEWGGFKADGHYYIETEEDLLQKFTTMEEFFVKLKTEQDMSDAQIDVAKETLKEQGIEYDHLMATGDLALTDIEMKEFGITQLDLRRAILAVIRSNQ